MENYIWIIIIIFVVAVVSYWKNNKKTKETDKLLEEKTLIGIGGIHDGQIIVVQKEIIIGRDPEKCSIVYPNKTRGVSAIHCSVRARNNKLELIDLSSSCGTFINNGEKLVPNKIYYLDVGDSFFIGNMENTFVIK